MDPGIGLLMVNSMVPTEAGVPKLPPKSTLQLPDGFLEKSHVRHALKYMTDDEQREKALEVAIAWKKKFAAEKWKPVIATIEAARREDHVRSSVEDEDLHLEHTNIASIERPRAMTVASVPVVPQATVTPMLPLHRLMRQHTATVSLPLRRTPAPLMSRAFRWDVIASGPVTPLSPRPSANSFSSWLHPKPAPAIEQVRVTTPVTAIYTESEDPTPPSDAEMREIYDEVKESIDALARRYCLARFKARFPGNYDFLPATMIKSKDTSQAAFSIVESRRVKLKEYIIKDLPARLQSCALAEAELRSRFYINNETELSEQNEWMNHVTVTSIPQDRDPDGHMENEPQPIDLAVSILDEQRAALRNFHKQRQSDHMAISSAAIEAAWAVKMLDDAEHLAKIEAENWSSSSDGDYDCDDGYSYGNFLRTIKNEMSTSSSSGTLASMVDELSNSELTPLRKRSDTHHTATSIRTRDSRLPNRASTSPSKDNRWSERLSVSTVSNNSNMHSSSAYPRSGLHITTETIPEVSTSELSPEDREFRRRGPDLTDLSHWAQELKKMEEMRVELQQSPSVHPCPSSHGRLSGPVNSPTLARQVSVDSINTRISPTRTSHSRFSWSSSSSTSTHVLKPPRPSFPTHSPSTSFSTLRDYRPVMLDHVYHQRMASKPRSHKRDTSMTSMHDSVLRTQHVRAAGNLSALVKHTSTEEEEDWIGELKRMENRERARQAEEKRITAELLRGDTLVESEDHR